MSRLTLPPFLQPKSSQPDFGVLSLRRDVPRLVITAKKQDHAMPLCVAENAEQNSFGRRTEPLWGLAFSPPLGGDDRLRIAIHSKLEQSLPKLLAELSSADARAVAFQDCVHRRTQETPQD